MIWYIIGHSNNPLTRLTASSFFWLMILAYTCVIFTSAWPSSLDVVYKSAPSVSIIVANVCRAVWNVKRLFIPAAFAHGLIRILTIAGDGRSNTWSSGVLSPRAGIHFNASGKAEDKSVPWFSALKPTDGIVHDQRIHLSIAT